MNIICLYSIIYAICNVFDIKMKRFRCPKIEEQNRLFIQKGNITP